jgi:chromosome segregation ATPase
LIASLLAALRAKNKANSALKAGLDGLRRFKAVAEANEHKLLARVDKLKVDAAEARDRLRSQQGTPANAEQLKDAHAKIATMEERLSAQAEIVQTLEEELKTAKALHLSTSSHAGRIEQLEQQLAAKNEAIGKLEADADEQQRKLAKLRGSESETMRLKGLKEQDRGKIDALEREIAQLREALARKESSDGSAGENSDSTLIGKLKERDSSIARLMGTVKEQETKLAELSESVGKWKRKYEFLSTEAPAAYQSVAEK